MNLQKQRVLRQCIPFKMKNRAVFKYSARTAQSIQSVSAIKTNQLMLFREIIALLRSTQNKNTLCGQNVELLNVKLAVHKVTTGL
jgi:hypothetical protein